jgi:LacI family transcriptional regulator
LCRPTRREKNLVTAAKDAAIPMALIAPDDDFGTGDIFRSSNRDGARELGDHLWSLGHRRFGFVGGPKESADARDRLQGLQDALGKWGARVPSHHVRYATSYGADGGREYAESYLRLPRERAPTAVVCGNDTIALGFMAKVLQNGVRVPRDVSVVGFDDVPEAQLVWPGVTTARQEARAIGAAACRAVLARAEGRNGGRATVTEFPTTLMVRQSTGPAPER